MNESTKQMPDGKMEEAVAEASQAAEVNFGELFRATAKQGVMEPPATRAATGKMPGEEQDSVAGPTGKMPGE